MEVDKEPTAVIKGKVRQEVRGSKNLKIIIIASLYCFKLII